jgi:hypothetical protein
MTLAVHSPARKSDRNMRSTFTYADVSSRRSEHQPEAEPKTYRKLLEALRRRAAGQIARLETLGLETDRSSNLALAKRFGRALARDEPELPFRQRTR